jgi:hypothetical protein
MALKVFISAAVTSIWENFLRKKARFRKLKISIQRLFKFGKTSF